MSRPPSADMSDQHAPAHFVPLSEIMHNHNGDLHIYMRDSGATDVVVTMSIKVDVAKHGAQKFFVAVAVTTQFNAPEPLSDEVYRSTPKGHQALFAWIPANSYGTDDFGIFIDELAIGENLKNGLVGEVIEKAAIEATVIALAKQ